MSSGHERETQMPELGDTIDDTSRIDQCFLLDNLPLLLPQLRDITDIKNYIYLRCIIGYTYTL